ncbi:MAG TPA: diguanylate cyclase [Anaerolineales bacterium]|nr:diguanylate cyclase [Anaerolineales bacterium]
MVWHLTVRSPLNVPLDYEVKSGKNTLGRKPDNNIVIADESASRDHAEIYCQDDLAVIYDVGSLNGTFVNRERITKPHVLQTGDQIRIGQHVITVAFLENGAAPNLVAALSGTRPLTRELLLESIDQNAVFMDAVASRLTTILDLETGLREISELTRIAVGAEKCEVIPADRFDQIEALEIPGPILRQSIEGRSVVIVPDLLSGPDPSRSENGRPLIRSVLCAPVIVDQDVVALIYAYNIDTSTKAFDQQDVQLMVTSSHLAALTIQRGRLLEKAMVLERLAITDSLTDVYNRRHILTLAEHEFQRAQRYRHPLTILILDLDDLKLINDVNGHLAGDQALQTIAEKVKKQLREADFIGRFGGDEFVILLTETDLNGGCIVAERIRQDVCATPISAPQGPLTITISIGVATTNEKSTKMADLLNQADIALIRAKTAGKNRVEVAE